MDSFVTHVEYFVSLNMCMYSIQCAYVFKPLNPATLTEVIFIGPYGLLNYCVRIYFQHYRSLLWYVCFYLSL